MEKNENSEEFEEEETLDEKTPHRFLSPWHFSDVVLVAEDTKFHVHKSTLSMWSPVFEKMFTSEFSERNAKEIPLPGKRAHEVEVLLNLIYSSGAQQEVTGSNYQFLLELAEEYQMEKVKELCANWLMQQPINFFNCIRRYNVAERFGLENLMSKCLEEASYLSYDRLEAVTGYKEMKTEVKLEICKKRIIGLEKMLAEYVAICSKLVAELYQQMYFKGFANVECDRKEEHPGRDRWERKKFEISCQCCMRRVKDFFCEIPIDGNLRKESKKLYDLERQDKVVLQLKRGARFNITKAKK